MTGRDGIQVRKLEIEKCDIYIQKQKGRRKGGKEGERKGQAREVPCLLMVDDGQNATQ